MKFFVQMIVCVISFSCVAEGIQKPVFNCQALHENQLAQEIDVFESDEFEAELLFYTAKGLFGLSATRVELIEDSIKFISYQINGTQDSFEIYGYDYAHKGYRASYNNFHGQNVLYICR